MAQPEMSQVHRALLLSEPRHSESVESMVSRLFLPQLLQSRMQVTTEDVRVRKGFSVSRAEGESRSSVADEYFEHFGHRRVKVHIPISVVCLEIGLHSAMAYFLSDQKGCAVISDVFGNVKSKCLADSETRRSQKNKEHLGPSLATNN